MFSRLAKLWKFIDNKTRRPFQKRKTRLLVELLEDRTVPSSTPFLQTNLPDYPPGGTVQIAGGNFAPGETVQLQVVNLTHPADSYPTWQVPDGSDGSLQTTWTVPSNADSLYATFQVTATGATGDTATTSFTDGPTEFQAITMNNPIGDAFGEVVVNQPVVFSGATGELADFEINPAYTPAPGDTAPTGPSSFTVVVFYGQTSSNPVGTQLPSSAISVTYDPATFLGTVSINLTYATTYFRSLPTDPLGQKVEVDITDNSSLQVDTATEGFQVFDYISGTKFQDNNGQGFANDSPYGGPAVTMDLYNGGTTTIVYHSANFAPGSMLASVTTAANGNYTFFDLGPGTYTVSEVVPTGWTETAPVSNTWTVPIASGDGPSTGNNFADFQNITISGTKLQDNTGGGFANDSAYTGPAVTIDLYHNGTPDGSTTTDANGNYSFTNLGPGTYSVSEASPPSGWTETGGNAGYTIVASSGLNSTANNFADFKNAVITGTKFEDLFSGTTTDTLANIFSQAGIASGPYPGLAGWTIDLLNSSGGFIASTTTASNGLYSFSVGPGTYEIAEVSESQWTQVFPNGSVAPANYVLGPGGFPTGGYYTIVVGGNSGVPSGTTASNNDFGNVEMGAIYGIKFEDFTDLGAISNPNNNPLGYTPVQGVTITLTGDTLLEVPVSLTTTTDANGQFSFTGLLPSDGNGYQVSETVPTGWTQTAGGGAIFLYSGQVYEAIPGQDSNLTAPVHPMYVETSNDPFLAFGDFHNIVISGTKYQDNTGAGFANDSAYAGPPVTIDLFRDGSPDGSTTTDANGNYSFTNLGPGTYTVSEVVPTGWVETAHTGNTIVAMSGVNSSGNNFADFQNITISGTKYLDANGSGFADETAYTGPAVTIDLSKNGSPDGSTTTDANGNYSFTNLGPGTYTVSEVVPTGWTETGGNAGYSIVATSGLSATGNNFADFQNFTISGTKTQDNTGGGFANDSAYTGPPVTIDLYANGNLVGTTTTDANGNYSFTNLGPGTYTVSEVVPSGWTETAATGANVFPGSAQTTPILSTPPVGGPFQPIGPFATYGADSEPGVIITIGAGGSVIAVSTGQGPYDGVEDTYIGVIDAANSGVALNSINLAASTDIFGFDGDGIQTYGAPAPTAAELPAGYTLSGYEGPGTYFTNINGAQTAGTVNFNDGTGHGLQPGQQAFFSLEEAIQTGGAIGGISGQNSTGNNFANFQNITISGTKYQDNTGGGFANDSTYTGPSVTVDLYQNGSPDGSTTTDANGNYSFTNLGPGTYTVSEVAPSGWTETGGNAGYTIVATSGLNSTANNFADFQNFNITGTKTQDNTGGGFANDSAYTGPTVTVDLYQNGNLDGSTTTDANGNYSFTNLGPGTYTVSEVVPTGWTETAQTGATIVASSGVNSTGNNFADFQNITISGTKYEDLNGSGVITAGDPPLSGVTIDLYLNSGASPIASTTTDANGNYTFTNLGPGTYTVSEVVPSGWTETLPDPGNAILPGFNSTTFLPNDDGTYPANGLNAGTPPGTPVAQPLGFTIDFYGVDFSSVYINNNGNVTFDSPLSTFTPFGLVNTAHEILAPFFADVDTRFAGSPVTFGTGTVDGFPAFGVNWINVDYYASSTTHTNRDSFQLIIVDRSDIAPGDFDFEFNYDQIQWETGEASGGDANGLGGSSAVVGYSNGTGLPGTSYQFTGSGVPGTFLDSNSTTGLIYNSLNSTIPGQYIFNVRNGTVVTTPPMTGPGYTIVATSGLNSTGNDFANFQDITISGTKYQDNTGGGFANDSAYAGPAVTVDLYQNGNLVGSTTTDANGNYSFTNLGPGTYTVSEIVPSGWTETAQTGATIAASSGVNSTGNNFADFQDITISGTKYQDNTGGGFANDSAYTGPTVTIDLYQNGTPDGSTTTDANGNYSFTNLGPGTYTVSEVVPTGWTETAQTGATIVAVSGLNSTGNNFADYEQNATISGTKYLDPDGTGFADETNYTGPPVTIDLYENGNLVATTTTDANSNYSFTHLGAGTYTVSEVVPSGWTETAATGATIVATGALDSTGNNFADFQNFTISGTKTQDNTGGGFANDSPYSGPPVTIDLYENGNLVGTTTTDANGNYSFTNLGPGTYTVSEVVPGGWTETAATGANVFPGSAQTTPVLSTPPVGGPFQPIGPFATYGADSEPGVIITIGAGGSVIAVSTGQGPYDGVEDTYIGVIDAANSGVALNSINLAASTDIFGFDGDGIQTYGAPAPTAAELPAGYTLSGYEGPGTYFTNINGAQTAGTVNFNDGTGHGLQPGQQAFFSLEEAIQTGGAIGGISGQNSTGNNFANFQNITISGTKYQDNTGGGFANDSAYTGPAVTVDLLQNGSPDGSTTTDANGNYSFTNLGPGTYTVNEVVPSGWTETGGSAGYTIVATSGLNSTANNFADFQNFNITGTKYLDPNGSGFANETAYTGPTVTVDLYQNGTPDGSTTTDANGNYSFTDLGPGTYTVSEVVPTGWTETAQTGATIVAVSGLNSTGNNFADYEQNATISGTKYLDPDGTGFADETNYTGPPVTIDLYENGNLVATTTTDANSNYSFTHLGAGTYTVSEVVPSGWTETAATGATIVATGALDSTGNNFADFQNFTISGTKTQDNTGGGFANDSPYSGPPVTIDLYENGNLVGTTTTDANGNYSFTNLGPGTYTVSEVVPGGWTETAATGANIFPGSAQTTPVLSTPPVGGPFLAIGPFMGYGDDTEPGTIITIGPGGSVSAISTGQGPYDGTDDTYVGVIDEANSGVALNSLNLAGTTDIFGFDGDGIQTYGASAPTAAELPAGYTLSGYEGPGTYFTDINTAQTAGTVNFNDGTGNGLQPGQQAIFSLEEALQPGGAIYGVSGQNSTGNNFANFQNITISGTKYLDANGSGFADETAYTGPTVTVDLYQNGSPDGSTTTDANGNYSFTNLGPGTYTVSEVVPSGWTETAQTGATIVATSGLNSTSNNFADFQNIAISGTKYLDPTGNGFANEAPYTGPSVTIDLYQNGSPDGTTTTDANGNYSFTNLGPGTYTVSEVVPSGWTETAQTGATIVASSGVNSTGNNFADAVTLSGPTLFTTASFYYSSCCGCGGGVGSDVVGSAIPQDSAVLSGGNAPTGTITFTLYYNGSPVGSPIVDNVTHGNGTYTARSPYPVTHVGLYTWMAYYSGDSRNAPASDQGGAAEEITVVKASPCLVTQAAFQSSCGGSHVVGTAVLKDTATLSGGYAETGSITFTLTGPCSSTPVFTDTITAIGNRNYTVTDPNPATEVGTYTWTVVFAGDCLNNGAQDQGGCQEQLTVVKASPCLVTNASFECGTGNLAGSAVPEDTAVLSGGYNVGGTITFTLTGPNCNVAYTQTVCVSGDGTYCTSDTTALTQGGTYTWSAVYSGNCYNNCAQDQGGASERLTVLTPITVCISGTKFDDILGNDCPSTIGAWDDVPLSTCDPNYVSVIIDLYRDGSVIASTQTDCNGNYSFCATGAGTYTVCEVVPNGWTETAQTGRNIVVTNCSVVSTGNNFADFKDFSISGTKYQDNTGQGFCNDSTYTGPPVTIDLYHDGCRVASTTTGACGAYAFCGLHAPGTYTVQEVVPSGWTETAQTGNCIVATSGVDSTCNNFADFHDCCFSGTVCRDYNGNGFANDGNYNGPPVTVYLYCNGQEVASTTTNYQGNYSFGNVCETGTYTVCQTTASGWSQTAETYSSIVCTSGGQDYTGWNFADYH